MYYLHDKTQRKKNCHLILIYGVREIVNGIKKVPIPSGIKHMIFRELYKAKIEVLVFITISKSPLFRTVW